MKPKAATVSEDVLQRVSAAIEEIATSETLRRSKREIESLTGLSHPTVARAFAQDARDQTEYNLNERFNALTAIAGVLSPKERAQLDMEEELALANARIAELEGERAVLLQTLYAFQLEALATHTAHIVPIKRPRGGQDSS